MEQESKHTEKGAMRMAKSENEIRREKAKNARYKKPLLQGLNIEAIKEELWAIQEECENVRCYIETDDDTLTDALNGDEDEAYEFKMLFADLCSECEMMSSDIEEEWVPECFDIFFCAAVSDASDYGGMLGYDSYEHDYYGITAYEEKFGQEVAIAQLERMTKKDLICAVRQCMNVFTAYMGLSDRYNSLKASLDILKGKNSGYLQLIKRIDALYNKASEEDNLLEANKEWERLLDALPQEAFVQ